MTSLIRLVYASRSTFTRSANHQGLDPGVARILAKSRKNNTQRQIVGGLLFGDGCFLQCLEGEAQAVQALYMKIAADPRHRDVTVLSQRPIVERSFSAWSMKYVPGEQALSTLLRSWGMGRFDPYCLSPDRLAAAVTLMQDVAEGADRGLEARQVDGRPGQLLQAGGGRQQRPGHDEVPVLGAGRCKAKICGIWPPRTNLWGRHVLDTSWARLGCVIGGPASLTASACVVDRTSCRESSCGPRWTGRGRTP